MVIRAGEETQQLRALVALAEEPGSSPSTHMVTHNPVPGDSSALFWSWAPGMHVIHKHTCWQNTHTKKIKIKKKMWTICTLSLLNTFHWLTLRKLPVDTAVKYLSFLLYTEPFSFNSKLIGYILLQVSPTMVETPLFTIIGQKNKTPRGMHPLNTAAFVKQKCGIQDMQMLGLNMLDSIP